MLTVRHRCGVVTVRRRGDQEVAFHRRPPQDGACILHSYEYLSGVCSAGEQLSLRESITKFQQAAQVSFQYLLENITRGHASNRTFLGRADMELKCRCARIACETYRLCERDPKEPPAPEITFFPDGTTYP